jgi:hypothetical protein
MTRRKHQAVAALLAAGALGTGAIVAVGSPSTGLTNVPAPNPKQAGIVYPNKLSPELFETSVAQGANKLENGTPEVPYYGYDGNGPMVPAAGSTAEAQKTEPDKNTYLTLRGQTGADPHYDYGTHFLYQGHEAGTPGYISRINLDADADHRVTLLATKDADGKNLSTIDGSTWDPFAHRLLFTTENANGPEYQATPGLPSKVEDISGAIGRGGYEGIQNDARGNLWIVEDVGGKAGTQNPNAKQPNSFVYRYVPKNPGDLKAGRLQALQVKSLRSGQPIVFHDGQADADIKSDDVKDLHTYGKSFETRWVTLHDTATDGSAPYSANALAKQKGATPFKRPENGVFRPGTHFDEFYFSETGDTSGSTEAGAQYGGFGGLFKLAGNRLSLFYRGDLAHTGLDNVSFLTQNELLAGEDAGDSLHSSRNALDSGYSFDTGRNYGQPGAQPLRFLAEGRDASATLDSGLSGQPGFHNDGDNEVTGIHVSNGDPGTGGILGAAIPKPWRDGWRVFYTQQHGDNFTWELLRRPDAHGSGDEGRHGRR